MNRSPFTKYVWYWIAVFLASAKPVRQLVRSFIVGVAHLRYKRCTGGIRKILKLNCLRSTQTGERTTASGAAHERPSDSRPDRADAPLLERRQLPHRRADLFEGQSAAGAAAQA